jgi:[acyl-carrier-protein] S-malonyltransferase
MGAIFPSSGVAVVFPGQASQHVGMGVALREASARADHVFALAEQVSNLPMCTLCAQGPMEELTRTDVAQLAVVATSLAALAVLEERLSSKVPVVATAGHSVGELAAMCFADALDIESTLRLVYQRGALMRRDSTACDGTMVAVLGLSAEQLEPICLAASEGDDGQVGVANLNAPGQVILSGARSAIERASERARASGARRILPLAVGGPFHSVYMCAAAADFGTVVETTAFATPRVPVVLNTDAQPSSDAASLCTELPRQITSPVRWDDTIRTLVAMGCHTFVELGPGDVLTGMTKRIAPEAKALAAGTPEAIEQLLPLFRA